MKESKIPLAGVIGCPIAHSKSPQIHGHWLKTLGLKGHYVPLHVKPEDLSDALRTMPKLGYVGANVTIPHKEQALEIADVVSDHAAKIGAANTLVFGGDGKIHADNTDGYGFVQNLRQSAPKWNPSAGPALVLGAGGAARAIIVALLDAGVPEILLSNRTAERAETLCQEFGPRLKSVAWDTADTTVSDAATLVNTTALGMTGKAPLTLSLKGLQTSTLVTDIVYAPLKTELLAKAEEAGCITVDGLGMLLHQAVPGFERWFGTRPAVDEATRQAALA
ncbi:Shikimate dehydrogenase [Roseovarius albus]|uniref:Shikimate dehydrogenase (NADP(+)) n=1 Tax=Roseovarius albus TaxID=1247867 RepID=A0A1X6Z4X9_9RHOB|nr:shikimate dehydrogenase [Roseovarius albus]SLN40623.1 Shikimate dehydrogenase [Roseovarius albus]